MRSSAAPEPRDIAPDTPLRLAAPRILTRRIQSSDAAMMLGVSRRTTQEMAARGELPGAARIGGIWTFDPDALAGFVRERECAVKVDRSRIDPASPAARRRTSSQADRAYERVMSMRFKSGERSRFPPE
jgi:excisionase family DNA binding protein